MITRYVVLNEHTLGVMFVRQSLWLEVLAGILWKGGHHWINGPVVLSPRRDQIRPATRADFDAFRVVAPTHFELTPIPPGTLPGVPYTAGHSGPARSS